MFPDANAKQLLQKEFDRLNSEHGQPTYELCERALQAAHRIHLTSNIDKYECALCSDSQIRTFKNGKKKKSKKHARQHQRWEVFNRFNMTIPSPAPRVLRRLNPVESGLQKVCTIVGRGACRKM